MGPVQLKGVVLFNLNYVVFKHNCVYPVAVLLDSPDLEAGEQPCLTAVGVPDGLSVVSRKTHRKAKLG